MRNIIVFFSFALIAVGCGKSEKVKNAELVVKQFFGALKNSDSASLKALYPGFSKLPAFYKSDTITISDGEVTEEGIVITVENGFTNSEKKTFNQTITLIVKDDESNMQIIDSRGLCRFQGQDLYNFGQKTGCVSLDTTISDQTKVRQMEVAEKLIKIEAQKLVKELTEQVPLSDLKKSETFGFVNGTVHLENNSPFPLYYLKYKAIITGKDGSVLKEDDGFASIDTVRSGQGKNFTFFMEQPDGAAHLDVHLLFDSYFLSDCLLLKKWTGKECDQVKP